MKKQPQYDFSKGERGKFYREDAVLQLPIYLEPDVQDFFQKIADSKNTDLGTVVNEILKSDIRLAKILK